MRAPGRVRRRPVAPPVGDAGRVLRVEVGGPRRGQRQRVQHGRGRGPGRLRDGLPGAGGPGHRGGARDHDSLGGAVPLQRGRGRGPAAGLGDDEVPERDVDGVDVAQLPLARELGRRDEEVPLPVGAAAAAGLRARGGGPRGGVRRGGGRRDGGAVERGLGALPPRRHRHAGRGGAGGGGDETLAAVRVGLMALEAERADGDGDDDLLLHLGGAPPLFFPPFLFFFN